MTDKYFTRSSLLSQLLVSMLSISTACSPFSPKHPSSSQLNDDENPDDDAQERRSEFDEKLGKQLNSIREKTELNFDQSLDSAPYLYMEKEADVETVDENDNFKTGGAADKSLREGPVSASPEDDDKVNWRGPDEVRHLLKDLDTKIKQYRGANGGIAAKGKEDRDHYSPEVHDAPQGNYPFQTPSGSDEGKRLAKALRYKDAASAAIRDNEPRAAERRSLVKTADVGLHQADNAFMRGAKSEAEFLMKASVIALDMAVSVSPAGWAYIGSQAMTGTNPLTGEHLNDVQRGIAITVFAVSVAGLVASSSVSVPAALAVGLVGKVLIESAAVDQEAISLATGFVSVPSIATEMEVASQSLTEAALKLRAEVSESTTLYRIGTTGRSQTVGAQYWSPESPLTTPNYATKYGIPPKNFEQANFVETARLKPGTQFITREAPGVDTNAGGGIEVVIPADGSVLQSHSSI